MKNQTYLNNNVATLVTTDKNGNTNGFIQVDEALLSKISNYRWCKDKDGYAVGRVKGKSTKMHKLLTDYEYVDHINRDKLDNRLSNLRPAEDARNQWNVGLMATNTTGYKGVTYRSRDKVFAARISVRGKRINLGNFKHAKETAKAYNDAATKYHKEYAYLNSI